MGSGELSMQGADVVLPQQLAYIFDYDTGFFLAHTADKSSTSPNHIQAGCPPSISCYIYIGSFGKLGWTVQDGTLFMQGNHLVIGKTQITNPSYILDVSGAAFLTDITAYSVSTSSDVRLKTEIKPAPPIENLLDIQPYFYKYKTRPDVEEFGVLAQEVEKIFPSCVRANEDGFKSVCYDKLGVALLPIVRKQRDEIDGLKAEMKEIKKALIALLERKE
jgi:hypothetical protein